MLGSILQLSLNLQRVGAFAEQLLLDSTRVSVSMARRLGDPILVE